MSFANPFASPRFNKQYVAENGDTYIDKKRWLWLLSVLVPLLTLLGPLLYIESGKEWMLWIPMAIFYLLIPLADWFIGEDSNNPPESIVPQLEADVYYRWITFLLVPVLLFGFAFTAWFVSSYPLSWSGWLAVLLVNGFICGYGINLGHEMGHKRSLSERWAAKIALSLSAYGHFNVEHNRGHHTEVATPDDVASSKLGETIYGFYIKEYPGAFVRACRLEKQRLNRKGHSFWHPDNEVIQGLLLTTFIYGALTLWLGWSVLPFLLLTALWGGFQLTSANYIEHYGLLRKKQPNGRYERCQPRHSWNSNFLLSNWSLFHLQRHSDHHANPMRRFQALRNFEEIPQLPAGYYAMFLLAYVPPLWFKVMDKRVIAFADGDPERLNLLPKKADKYLSQLSQPDTSGKPASD